jgi:hypothetical protein
VDGVGDAAIRGDIAIVVLLHFSELYTGHFPLPHPGRSQLTKLVKESLQAIVS